MSCIYFILLPSIILVIGTIFEMINFIKHPEHAKKTDTIYLILSMFSFFMVALIGILTKMGDFRLILIPIWLTIFYLIYLIYNLKKE